MENRLKSPSQVFSPGKSGQIPTRSSIMQNITNSSTIFRRSVISTSKSKNSPRNGATDRSKIKTLPNYQRYSMGNNLPFVTVFQTIEIERLSDEIQTQRVKLKQCERQIFNASNFEVQIKELSERCTAYEVEIGQYRDELDKMNKICETLFHEKESLKNKQKNMDVVSRAKLEEEIKKNKDLTEEVLRWTQKYQMCQQSKQNQIETIKSMMQKQRKSMIEREMKDLQVKHQSQIAKLAIQIRRLNDVLVMKERDIEDLQNKYVNSQNYINELKKNGLKLNEYEEKICLLSQEHLRLSQILDLNVSELEMAKKKEFKLAQQLSTDKDLAFDNEHLKVLVQEKQKQLENWRNKMNDLEEQLRQGRQLVHINSELESKLTFLYSENEKLIKLLKERSLQIEKWKRVALDLQQEKKTKRELQDRLIEQEAQCKVLKVENQRIENINKVKVKQLEQLRNKISINQSQLGILSKLETEKKILQDKLRTQTDRILQLQHYIQKLQASSTGINQTNNKLRSAQSIIESFKRENERLQTRIVEVQSQLSHVRQNQLLQGKQFGKLKQIQNVATQYEGKITIMGQEINRLADLLKAKNSQIASLEDEKINSYTISSQYKSLQYEVEEKQRIILKLKSQVETYQLKLRDYQQKMEDIDEKNKDLFDKLKQQIEQLESEVKQRSKQCDNLRIKQAKMQNQLCQASQLQKLCQKQQNRIAVYLRDLQDLRIQNKEYQACLNEEKKRVQQLQKKSELSNSSSSSHRSIISNLSVDPEQLIKKINQLQFTLKDLKIKYSDLQRQVGGSINNISMNSPTNSSRNIR